jgi:hypothetical protein
MIRMQMSEKHLSQKIKGDHQRRQVRIRTGADIEQELVPVAHLNQPTGGRLTSKHPGRPLNYKFLLVTATNVIILWVSRKYLNRWSEATPKL